MSAEVVTLLIGLVVGIVIGAVCAFTLSLQRIVALQTELKKSAKLEEKFKDSFKVMANEILEANQKKMKEENQENIGEILKPFENNIKEFKSKVEETHKDNIERSAKIVEKISTLERLNVEMTKETDKLARALKGDNRFQGDWGEVVLENLLSKSGLIEGEEYYKQGKELDTTNEQGVNMKPDYVVKLPEDKCLIIDSKVSLKAYEDYLEAGDDVDRNLALSELTASIKTHIQGLAGKDYTSLKLNTPKFVLMFMPVEGAYAAALSYDKKIFDYAVDKNIMVVTPTTLLPSLWLVSYIWKGEKQTKNAMEMARQTGLLYDKVVTFIESFEQVGSTLDKAKGIYDRAFNTLKNGRGNIVSKIENIKRLGASSTKMLSKDIIREATSDVILGRDTAVEFDEEEIFGDTEPVIIDTTSEYNEIHDEVEELKEEIRALEEPIEEVEETSEENVEELEEETSEEYEEVTDEEESDDELEEYEEVTDEEESEDDEEYDEEDSEDGDEEYDEEESEDDEEYEEDSEDDEEYDEEDSEDDEEYDEEDSEDDEEYDEEDEEVEDEEDEEEEVKMIAETKAAKKNFTFREDLIKEFDLDIQDNDA